MSELKEASSQKLKGPGEGKPPLMGVEKLKRMTKVLHTSLSKAYATYRSRRRRYFLIYRF